MPQYRNARIFRTARPKPACGRQHPRKGSLIQRYQPRQHFPHHTRTFPLILLAEHTQPLQPRLEFLGQLGEFDRCRLGLGDYRHPPPRRHSSGQAAYCRSQSPAPTVALHWPPGLAPRYEQVTRGAVGRGRSHYCGACAPYALAHCEKIINVLPAAQRPYRAPRHYLHHGQPLAPLGAAAAQDAPTALGGHPCTKAQLPEPRYPFRLVGPFHAKSSRMSIVCRGLVRV